MGGIMADTADEAALRDRISELERENQRLRERSQSSVATPNRRGRWRAVLSAACIALAVILVPVSTLTGWTRTQLVSEDDFVATFAPLAEDRAVQDLVIDTASTAIVDAVDVDALTSDLFDGLAALGLPPRAQAAVSLLRAPAAAGVTSLVQAGVTTAVESDAFAQLWRTALATSHRTLVAAATSDPDGVVAIGSGGEVGIQIGPIIDAVSAQLVANGFALAAGIPSVDVTIVVAQSDALPMVATGYLLAVTVGAWLPPVALLLLAAGVAVARSRRIAVLGAGIGIGVGSFTLATLLAVGTTAATVGASALGVPAAALEAIYLRLVGDMRDTAVVLGLIGVIMTLTAWMFSPGRAATATRRFLGSVTDATRDALRARGLRTGRFGAALARFAIPIQSTIAIAAVLILFALRPVDFGTVLAVTLGAAVVFWASILLQPPPDHADAAHTRRPR